VFAGFLLAPLWSCSSDDEGLAPAAIDPDQPLVAHSAVDRCATPNVDCPCGNEGEQLDCGTVHEVRGDYVICSMGVRHCSDGVWTDCSPDRLVQAAPTETSRGLRLQALSAAADCENLCDPQCNSVADTPDGLVVADDLDADADGLTLANIAGGGHCNDINVSPAHPTLSITGIAANGAVTIDPASLTFSATCSSGLPIQPSWTIDSYDRAVINGSGKLTVFSGIGSPIVVTATSSMDTTTALVDVIVNIVDPGSSPSVATAFNAAGSSTDTAKTLYPYKNTVFPLDLKAPLVQWETGGNNATEVQVALRFPAGSSSPSFWYSKIYNTGDPKEGTLSSSVPAWIIPQQIWSAFDRSAKLNPANPQSGEIIIQRRYGGTVRPELKIPVSFASEPLYGTAYYTQYRRNLSACSGSQSCTYNAASYTPGQTCQVGNNTHPSSTANISMTRAIDLSLAAAPNKDPFNGTAGCPVCHSVSANGNVYVSGNQAWQALGTPVGTSKGLDTIGLSAAGDPLFTLLGSGIAPTYTGLADTGVSNAAGDPYNNYERTGENSRGFSYGAITPDGSLVLQGPAFWGNTQDTPAGLTNNTQNATLTGLTGSSKPYFFAKTSQPGVGVQVATTGTLASISANTWSAPGTITGSSGSLTIDGVALTVGAAVLVKDEATQSHNGVYSLTVPSPWKLVRRYDADASGELTPNMEVRVSDGSTHRGKVFYISSPASGTINPAAGSPPNIVFTQRAIPGMAFTTTYLNVDYATTAALPSNVQALNSPPTTPATLTASAFGVLTVDGVAVGVNKRILVKDEGSPSAKNGVYTLSTVGTASVKWILKRTSDADQTGELTALDEVKVGVGGAANSSKVFYVSTTGTLTYSSLSNTAISLRETELPSMMVPVFSPNGTKIAYVNGDADATRGLADTGWRRGLSMLSFDQATMTVSKKVRLHNTWSSGSAGIPIKWPFFESDSRGLLYVETEATEFCGSAESGHGITIGASEDQKRACFEASYGSMSPTTRGYWKGRIWSIDTQTPSTTKTELRKLNEADDDGGLDDAVDGDRSYQPTVLPNAVGNYRWVVFTSPRAYGNQFNQKSSAGVPTHFSCAASMLWMAALDDVTAGTSDRSHPAFLLPGQNIAAINTANHYVNERGYVVPTPCKTSGVSCSSDEQCCGSDSSPATSACRAPTSWTPASGPPAKTCSSLSGTCSNAGQSCNSPSDCCNAAACVDLKCAAPPSFDAASFERDYTAECPDSYQPNWQLISYYLTATNGSHLDFSVQTASTLAGLDAAVPLSLGQTTGTVLSPATPAFKDVGAALNTAHVNGRNYLRLTIDLSPSNDGQTAPILHDWELRYTCEAAQ
jgi:hypothetical protein